MVNRGLYREHEVAFSLSISHTSSYERGQAAETEKNICTDWQREKDFLQTGMIAISDNIQQP